MSLEIERKYLVEADIDSIIASRQLTDIWSIQVSYVNDESMQYSYRLSKSYTKTIKSHKLTRKSKAEALVRQEEDIKVSDWGYDLLLKHLFAGRIDIVKTRYVWQENGLEMELDLFNKPKTFSLLEIELETEQQQVILPSCLKLIKEVTTDPAYYGQNIG